MPLIQSAIKRAKQTEVRRKRRQPVKTYMKTTMKSVRDLAAANKLDEAQKALPLAYKAIDMAAKKNIIHKRTAARKKSLVSRYVAVGKKK